ncbi:tetratricopeptide repeat protein [Fulvivirga sp. 29W222]|uniref:Tetratricopeptide repeat protein n=1 Tax=Fulvivirga marina TaxID=2494733 RepID=A0A937G632_9BACT|nr:tetratricopeptide repeat protein [Fulvivirga marina]MBL6449111.1 tetratricopeptide repeat protein [Fulvivirga marina]
MSLKIKLIIGLCGILFGGCVEHSKDALLDTEIKVNPNEALEYLRELADDDPDNPEVFYQLSKVYFDQGNYSQAQRNIRKAVDIKGDYSEYHFMEGKIYQQLNKPEEAVKALLLAESMGNINHELYQIIAEEYMRLGMGNKAKEAISRLTSINQSAESYTLQGQIMLSLGDTTEAITNFEKSISLNKAFKKPFIVLTDINIARNNVKRAFSLLNHLIEQEPENLGFLERKGDLLQRTGLLDSAAQIFKYIASKRDDYMNLYKLSNIYYLMGEYDSSRVMAEKAFMRNEGFLDAQLVVARSLDKLRKYQEAIDVYELIVESDSTFNLAITELDNLKRKVAYLWRLEQQRRALENVPPPVQKKELQDN